MTGVDFMISELARVNGIKTESSSTNDEKIQILKVLMTISKPATLSDQYYMYEKDYLELTKNKALLIDVGMIQEQLTPSIFLHKGDITHIKADAIVNAANEKLLGCFVPGHHCIDNAIHLSAGLGLRNACNRLMTAQGKDEEVGMAKVTNGFNLPSKYVVHTVGPNLNAMGSRRFDEAKKLLKDAYVSCLEAVKPYEDIKSIVFCSISTGVYGFPIEEASFIAMETIETYLEKNEHHLEKVVIDVFSKEDFDAYKKTSIKRRERLRKCF